MDVAFNEVSYEYNDAGTTVQALNRVTLRVPAGRFVAVIGASGAGKSTLVQHLNGLLLPTKGTVEIGDVCLPEQKKQLQQLRKKVGFVFQYPEHQLFEETVEKEIGYALRMQGVSKVEAAKTAAAALHTVGLPPALLSASPFQLSGGQKRRVAIASVLVQQPKLLVLDEPGAGLDPASKEALFQLLCNYRQTNNASIWMVTHSMDDVAKYADFCIVMQNGTPLMVGEPAAVFQARDVVQTAKLALPRAMAFAQKAIAPKETIPFLRDAATLADWLIDRKGGQQ